MKKITTILFLLCVITGFGQKLTFNWKSALTGKVLAGPLVNENVVYAGDMNGTFFALDLKDGKEKWRYETNGNIQAKATLVNGNVFFESANVFYLIDSKKGMVIWSFDPGITPFVFKYQDREWPYKIDPYDDKRSVATFSNGIIYIGASNGKLYGLNATTGKVEVSFTSDDGSAIRSSPFIEDGKLYFGDWSGVVYCYNIEDQQLIWKKKTYRWDKPYGTFGGIATGFATYQGLLFFGARNHMMNVLDKQTGEKDWTYTDAQGGWMITDPVIFNDTLYIGGSDNFTMYAFNPKWGKPLWSTANEKKNIYTKPVVTKDYVIYTAGSAYNEKEPGVVIMLDRKTGQELSKFITPMGTLSPPQLVGDQLIFGCYDGNVYSLNIKLGT